MAESYISEAIARGDLSNLPGEGKPLQLDDYRFVPEERRTGYRMLKNAGFIPPELVFRREISGLESLISKLNEEDQKHRAVRRLNYLLSKLGDACPNKTSLFIKEQYCNNMADKLADD